MMNSLTGAVEDVWTKSVNTKRGPAEVMWIRVNGAEVNCGFKNQRSPKFEKGQYVSINVEENKFRQLEYKGQATPGAGTVQQLAPVNKAPAYEKKTDFPVPKDDKGMSICRQSSLKVAVDVANKLMDVGFIKSQDDYEMYIVKMTMLFTDLVTGQNEDYFLRLYGPGAISGIVEEDPNA